MDEGIKWYIWLNHFGTLVSLVCQCLLKAYFSPVTADRLTACSLHLNSIFNMTNCDNIWILSSAILGHSHKESRQKIHHSSRTLGPSPVHKVKHSAPLSNPISKPHHESHLIRNALTRSLYQLASTQKAYSSGSFLYTVPLFKYKTPYEGPVFSLCFPMPEVENSGNT